MMETGLIPFVFIPLFAAAAVSLFRDGESRKAYLFSLITVSGGLLDLLWTLLRPGVLTDPASECPTPPAAFIFTALFYLGFLYIIPKMRSAGPRSGRSAPPYSVAMVLLASLCGIAASYDIFAVFIFICAADLSVFVIMSAGKTRVRAFRRLFLGAVPYITALAGVCLVVMASGSSGFRGAGSTGGGLAVLGTGMAVFSFIMKTDIFPFCLPDFSIRFDMAERYVPVLAGFSETAAVLAVLGLSSAAGLAEAGSGASAFMVAAGAFSAVAGAVLSLCRGEDRARRFSDMAQTGCVLAAAGVCSPLAVSGALCVLVNKFLCGLCLSAGRGEEDNSGAWRTTAVLSAAGLPPFFGFWGRLLVIMALWEAGYLLPALFILFSGLFTVAGGIKDVVAAGSADIPARRGRPDRDTLLAYAIAFFLAAGGVVFPVIYSYISAAAGSML